MQSEHLSASETLTPHATPGEGNLKRPALKTRERLNTSSPTSADQLGTATLEAPRRAHSYLYWPLVVYLAIRAATLAALGIVNLFIHNGIWGEIYRWDGVWFIHAVIRGYPSPLPMIHGHVNGNTIAFFPAFPLLIRWFSHLTTVSPVVVGAVISGLTGLTATAAVGMLTRHFAGEGAATRAALLFAVFPGTVAFSMIYSEGLLITCVAFGLLALLRRQWWLAGLLGLVATATNPIAVAFAAACAWCSLWAIVRQRNWQSLLAPVLAPLGFIAYMAYLWIHTGTFNAWTQTERGGWKSYPSFAYPAHVISNFISDPLRPTMTGQILFVGTLITIVLCVVAIRQHLPSPILLYGLFAAIIAAASAPVGLRPRFIMLAFPLIVALAVRLRGRAFAWTVAVSSCGLVYMTVLELFSKSVFP